jgi:hypothetical protein
MAPVIDGALDEELSRMVDNNSFGREWDRKRMALCKIRKIDEERADARRTEKQCITSRPKGRIGRWPRCGR